MKYVVTRYEVSSPKVRVPFTCALVSDLHSAEHGKGNRELLMAIKEEAPDLILAAGDLLVGNALLSRETAERFMRALPEIAPTFYANGNHERRLKAALRSGTRAYSDWIKALSDGGVRVVNNSSESILVKGNKVRVYGLDLPLRLYRKFRRPRIRPLALTRNLGFLDPDFLNILIAHNPEFTDAYLDWGADLSVSGHYHGGLIRSPFSGRALLSPYGYFLPKYGVGLFKREGRCAVVSAGLGDHAIPIRIFDPRELVLIRVVPLP